MNFHISSFSANCIYIFVILRFNKLFKPSTFFFMFVSAILLARVPYAQSMSDDGRSTVEESRKPASVAVAAQAIDLSTFPLLPNVLEIHSRSVSYLEYVVRVKSFDLRSEYEFQRRKLIERKWQELPDGDGQFTRSGFHLYLTVQMHDELGKAVVKMQNSGNVDVSRLPVPPGTKYVKTAYNVADFETTTNVKETTELVRALLIEDGWQPYGVRGDVMDMKKNAVLLTASITTMRQPGLTRIAYWTTQMPVELPLPPNSESMLYRSNDNQLVLVAMGSMDEVTSYYKTALSAFEWKATSEEPRPEPNSRTFVLTFRNPANDMLRLSMTERKEKTRVTLKYLAAAEVKEATRKP